MQLGNLFLIASELLSALRADTNHPSASDVMFQHPFHVNVNIRIASQDEENLRGVEEQVVHANDVTREPSPSPKARDESVFQCAQSPPTAKD